MKRALSLVFFLGAACMARGDFNAQDWQVRIAIDVKQPGAVAAIVVSPAVYKASRAALRDLRIVRAGSEIPYRLRTLSA